MSNNFFGRQDFPVEAVMPVVAQQYTEIIVGILLAITFLWGLVKLAKDKDQRLLICMASGFFMVLIEAHSCVMIQFVYPPVGQHILYSGFARPIPIFMGMEYCAFFGLANYLYLTSGAGTKWSAKVFWVGFASVTAAEALLEVVSIHFGLWAYFGDQAMLLMNFPFHVAVIVAGMCLVFGEVSRIWFARVRGARQWLMVLIGPALMLGLYTIFAYPVSFGLKSGGGVEATRIGSAITMIVSAAIAYYAVKLLLNLFGTPMAPPR